jgi:dienelactone hydrolase
LPLRRTAGTGRAYGAAAGLQRGWNVLICEGPGQGSTLFERKVPFTGQWENVVTPIVSRLLRHPGVDLHRIVLTGFSKGGDLVARAAAYEHRLAALVCEPGAPSPWLGFSAAFRATITADKTATNETWNTKTVPALMKRGAEATRYTLAKRYEPFGAAILDAVRQGTHSTDIWTPCQLVQSRTSGPRLPRSLPRRW